ncbi:hypothetical protein BFW01_g8399 [Lasiodiplodia theobromae]|nr:hypothetical protein BFW01_g8399 [Lasiodiplodia theobromae]
MADVSFKFLYKLGDLDEHLQTPLVHLFGNINAWRDRCLVRFFERASEQTENGAKIGNLISYLLRIFGS